MVKIKRKTRIALCIEERLLVRTRESGDKIAPTSGPPSDWLQGGTVSIPREKVLPTCKDE
jgi:hypothetical protein